MAKNAFHRLHLSAMEELTKGYEVADVPVIIATLDLVLGDR